METQKKRAKCETSTRHTIILNSLNPKERIISDFLSSQYNKSDAIKNILYEYIITNNLQADTKPIISNLSVNSNQVISNNTNDDKYITSNNTINDNKQHSKDTTSDKDFAIDLSDIEDEEVDIAPGKSEEDATSNAMDFLLKM